MYMSPSVSKRLLLVPILAVVAIQLLFVRAASSVNITNTYLHHKCFVSQGKYKPGSQYEKNLKRIRNEISPESFKRGYNSTHLGAGPDFIIMFLQCRGDTHGPKCRSCYANAQPEVTHFTNIDMHQFWLHPVQAMLLLIMASNILNLYDSFLRDVQDIKVE